MPELPEVEIIKRGLEQFLGGQPRLERFHFFRKDLRDPLPIKQLRRLEGQRIVGLERRAKYLLFATETGGFLSHLGMTGSWRRETVESAKTPVLHDHIQIFLSNGDVLTYHDPRRFGVFDILTAETRQQRLAHLGPEPLADGFSGDGLWQSLRRKNSSIKAAIMDQRIVVGVGNIYASEALFQSRLNPQTRASKVSRSRAEQLVASIRQILQLSIAAGGSTISDYRNADGNSGAFQNRFSVYDQRGLPCPVCQTAIRRRVTVGRATYWCPKCQP